MQVKVTRGNGIEIFSTLQVQTCFYSTRFELGQKNNLKIPLSWTNNKIAREDWLKGSKIEQFDRNVLHEDNFLSAYVTDRLVPEGKLTVTNPPTPKLSIPRIEHSTPAGHS